MPNRSGNTAAPKTKRTRTKKAPPDYNATLINRIQITPHLAIFQVRPDLEHYPFDAGQFAILGLKHLESRVPESDPEPPVDEKKQQRLIRRAYSISSGSHEENLLEFYVSLVTSGQLTPRLFAMTPGARLFLSPTAKGLFTLDRVPAGRGILMVATGTGLAPYMSMVRTLALGIGCPAQSMTIMHGARYSWDLGYRSELESLQQQCEKFRYLPVISRPETDKNWGGRHGRLNTLFEENSREEMEEMCGLPL
ncbi:MAG: ferredoxin--NADP reductase, partial [Magnetococcales bacterium]|nr:ferredoxin--NADP reductase [Magnetococcales bacterium]